MSTSITRPANLPAFSTSTSAFYKGPDYFSVCWRRMSLLAGSSHHGERADHESIGGHQHTSLGQFSVTGRFLYPIDRAGSFYIFELTSVEPGYSVAVPILPSFHSSVGWSPSWFTRLAPSPSRPIEAFPRLARCLTGGPRPSRVDRVRGDCTVAWELTSAPGHDCFSIGLVYL